MKFKKSINDANEKTLVAVKDGVKLSVSRTAHKVLLEQVKKMLGDKCPDFFEKSPIGKALLDFGSCYIVMAAAGMFPENVVAEKASRVAEFAMTAATYDNANELTEMAKELISAAALCDVPDKIE